MANSVFPKITSVMVSCFCICMVVVVPYAKSAPSVVVAFGVAPCLFYFQGTGPLGSPCFGGVTSLDSAANATADRKTACGCLKQLATGTAGIKPNLATSLPFKCGVNIGYPSASLLAAKVK